MAVMRTLTEDDILTEDDLDEIVIEAAGDGRHRQAAAQFEDLAARPELHGQVSASMLLVHAGGQYGLADDWDEAVRCYRAAVVANDTAAAGSVAAAAAAAMAADDPAADDATDDAAAGVADIDPRVWLHDALVRKGDEAEATTLRAEIKSSRSTNPDVYAAVAETLAEHGRQQEALTWFTMGFHRCQDADVPVYMLHLLLIGRRAIRRNLGFPPDELDEIADAYVDHLEATDNLA
ncbi:conserved hypothetical protein [Parafrankia sp. EAN1pec]|uniref:hypothetical protein n=1 Tax=Parafrankia sp. (strain EAN1pec) TaxID=298653 RepID=UPI0000540709|nr:conserved hypothetical protein [Frankia sp. EAN1pec]